MPTTLAYLCQTLAPSSSLIEREGVFDTATTSTGTGGLKLNRDPRSIRRPELTRTQDGLVRKIYSALPQWIADAVTPLRRHPEFVDLGLPEPAARPDPCGR